MQYDPDQVATNIGLRIAEQRKKLRLTQAELSVRLRSTVQWVSLIEGGRNLTIHTLVRIANVLGVRPEDLFKTAKKAPPRRRGRPRSA